MENKEGKIRLLIKSVIQWFDIADISYINGNGNYSEFYMLDGNKYIQSRTLKRLDVINLSPLFYRISKGCIINLTQIKSVKVYSKEAIIILKSGTSHVCTRRRVKAFLLHINYNPHEKKWQSID